MKRGRGVDIEIDFEKIEQQFLAELDEDLKLEMAKPESEQDPEWIQGLKDAITTIRDKIPYEEYARGENGEEK
jgi:hypothetical protein